MLGSPKIKSQKQPVGKGRISSQMDNCGSSSETNRLSVDVDVQIPNVRKRQVQKQQSKTSNNDGPISPGVKRMSMADMLASAERLSKNLERKMSKPIIKKESRDSNVNGRQIKKVPMVMSAATVPRRSVFEMTKTRLLVPLTTEPARLDNQCTHEKTVTKYMTSKKDVAVQTVPQNYTFDMQNFETNLCDHDGIAPTPIKCSLFQKQSIEIGSTDGQPPQPFTRKTLNLDSPFKDVFKKLDKFLKKNMKTRNLFEKNMDNLSARRTVAAASDHNYWKYLAYFSSFSIGVVTTYMLNYGWDYLQRIK